MATGPLEARFRCHYLVRAHHIMVHAFGRAGLRADAEILGPAVSTLAYVTAWENRKSPWATWRPDFAVIISYVLTTSWSMRLEGPACGLMPRFWARQFRHCQQFDNKFIFRSSIACHLLGNGIV
jgi:hypothetical protein